MRRTNRLASYPDKLFLTFIFLIALSVKGFAQQDTACVKFLKQEIQTDNPQQIINNIKTVNCFGLDSVDLQIFGNGPILGSLLIERATQSNKKITYEDLLSGINLAKSDTGYTQLRATVIVMNTLEATKATPATWESSRGLLKKVNISDTEVEKLHTLMLQNQDKNWNYRQLVVFYESGNKTN